MSDLSEQELESIASSYERLLVPGFFRDYAEKTLDKIDPKEGESLLDVACGTGVLARAAHERICSSGTVIGLDMNPGMLSVARDLDSNIQWTRGQAEELPFEEDRFDMVTCQFSLMFFEDKEAAIGEMIRVLKPGGQLAVTVLGDTDDIPAYDQLLNIYADVAGDDIDGILRAPFSLGDEEKLNDLVARSSLDSTQCSIQEMEVRASWPDMRSLVLADVDGWFPLAGLEFDESQVDQVIRRAQSELTGYVAEGGRIEFAMPAFLVSNT